MRKRLEQLQSNRWSRQHIRCVAQSKRSILLAYQIAYVSLSTAPLDVTRLSDILTVSQLHNTHDGITGILMYHDLLFFQVLEGERSSVERCYDRVKRDPRHSGISLIWEGDAETRSFPTWSMGYVGPDEIGHHTKQKLASLSDLKSRAAATAQSDCLALQLALQVFGNFSGVDTYGQSLSRWARAET
ncbi:MAG: BLUF domain-containing protein [Alphaproteobacteria bacterium]|nr:BLUF domain-containing protein [Alphaproteobacteria bacterium]